MSTPQRTHNDYTVGWICPLEVEQIAAVEMLDEEHHHPLTQPITDNNSYTRGSIQNHNVVIAGLPITGNNSTATVVAHMRSTFSSIRFVLLVGIGGGVPKQMDTGGEDVRLGHVVVSKPTGEHSGVIQYDHGKAEVGEFRRTGSLAPPPNVLLNAAQKLAVARARAKKDPLQQHLQRIDTKIKGLRRYKYPGRAKDDLYQSYYIHTDRNLTCQQCGCDASKKVIRPADSDEEDEIDDDEWVEIHRGTIASGELVMRNGELRDKLAKQYNILCFEMEAAGALNDFPCLVIRGISDYSDSHKNDKWHGFAAASAAAYARELFFHMPIDEVAHCKVTESDIQQLIQDNSDILVTSRGISSTVENMATQNILSMLPYAYEATFDSFEKSGELNSRCLNNTRVDLLKDVRNWIADPQGKSLFWLNGMAGTGKSTISRTVAEELKQNNQLGANFFFKVGQGDCGTAERFITTMASQMALSFPVLIPHIKDVLEVEDPHISRKDLDEQFEKLIFQPLAKVKDKIATPIVIVIDALDECRPRRHATNILSLLSKLRDLRPLRVRAFLSSRPEQELRSGFEEIKRSGYQDIILHQIPELIITHDIEVFLRHHFSLIRSKYENDLDADWPGETVLKALVAKAQPLFIFAATICRFIYDGNDPEDRLQSVLDNCDDEAYDKVHNTYKPILDRLIDESTTHERSKVTENFHRIVGSIVSLFEPLSVKSLAILLSDSEKTVKATLRRLHSLLDIPKDIDLPVRTLHLSFVDFLLDAKRRNTHAFWLDAVALHEELADRCLKLILSNDCPLKQDICGIRMPGILRADIDTARINNCLSPEIQYACRYWVAHLEKAKSDRFEDSVHEFLGQRFLFWFEALSLLGRAWELSTMMSTLLTLFAESTNLGLKAAIYDARRFVMANSHVADMAPLQLYSSCLIFSPQRSITRTKFSRFIPAWLKRKPIVPDHWDIMLQTLEGHSDEVSTVAFSPDGKLLASGSDDDTIKLWDMTSGGLHQTLKCHSERVYAVAFSPDGKLLASGSHDGTVRLWDIASEAREPQQILENHSRVYAVAFSPDGTLLASGSHGQTIRLWDMTSGELHQTLEDYDGVCAVAFSSDSKFLASGSTHDIKLWNVASGELHQTLDHFSDVKTLAFSPDGKLLATGSYDNIVRLWDVASGARKPQQILKGHSGHIFDVSFSPNGKLIASGSTDKTIKLWDTAGELQQILGSGQVYAVAFSPDGKILASSSPDKTIKLWDTAEEPQQTFERHSAEVGPVAFSPNGRILASGSWDSTVKLWTTAGELQQTLKGHLGEVTTVTFSPDGRILASSSRDKIIRLWNMAGELQQTLEGHRQRITMVAFSSDGRILASGSEDGIIKLWNVAGELQHSIKGRLGVITALALSSDSKLLATSSHRKTIELWDVISGQLRQIIQTNGFVRKVSFHESLPLIISNQGNFQILQDIAPIQSQDINHASFDCEDDWLLANRKKLLWLPPDYRPAFAWSFDQVHGHIGFGLKSGRVVRLEISLDELDPVYLPFGLKRRRVSETCMLARKRLNISTA